MGFEHISKLGCKSWEGYVKEWKQCSKCGDEWTPISLKEGICPVCRGLESRSIPSSALLIFMEKPDLSWEERKEILSNAKSLLRCSRCSTYYLSLLDTVFGVICEVCYKKLLNIENQKKKVVKTLKDEIEEE